MHACVIHPFQACLRAGSDMDAVNADGNTAAHLAFKFGRSEIGECVSAPPPPPPRSWPALARCICRRLVDMCSYVTICRYLLTKGASDSIENKDGLTCRALARPQQQA